MYIQTSHINLECLNIFLFNIPHKRTCIRMKRLQNTPYTFLLDSSTFAYFLITVKNKNEMRNIFLPFFF